MRAVTKITFVDDENEKFFGEGPYRLLVKMEEKGSLRAAAMSMGMAYTKALKLITQAEKALGFALADRSVGGKSGGGSVLTPKGKAWVEKYAAYRDACLKVNAALYEEFFPEEKQYDSMGCVIMASGLGVRFGSNKLMADFAGRPVISYILEATEGIFAQRVVVTRHRDVEALCKEREIPVIYHELPYRSDTIRLGLSHLLSLQTDGFTLQNCMFVPGDQPVLSKETVMRIAERAAKEPDRIIRAAYEEISGMPVVFPREVFQELLELPEGKGGKEAIKNHEDLVERFAVAKEAELRDIDTPEDLRQLLNIIISSGT